MSLLAGPHLSSMPREPLLWCAALLGALLLHSLVVVAWLWQPSRDFDAVPTAAPIALDLSMLAAPQTANVLPPGPEQAESTLAPEHSVTTEAIEKAQDVEVPEAHNPEVALQSHQKTPENVPEPPELADTATPQETPANETPSDQAAPENTAPVSFEAAPSEVVSAPAIGELNQQQIDAIVRWQSIMQAHLERRKRYPRQAQIKHLEGVPWVTFTMNRAGKVLKAQLARASGIDVLDKEVVALVYRAEPLPPPPDDIVDDSLTLTVPVEFFIQL